MSIVKRWFILTILGVALAVGGCSSGSQSSAPETVTDQATVTAFVDEAVAYAKKNGKEATLAAINDPKGPFHRGELYIYAYDYDGNVIAHGGDASLVGKNLLDMTDKNGVKVIQSLIKATKDGSGWVTYVWPNPEHGNAQETKLGYAKAVDDTWWLGSGTYAKTS